VKNKNTTAARKQQTSTEIKTFIDIGIIIEQRSSNLNGIIRTSNQAAFDG
jgi:hypothetical protein